MNRAWVMTVLGPDRPGIVEALADRIRQHGGSWQESRLAHLQDQFAGIIEFTLPEANFPAFEQGMLALKDSHRLQCQFCGVNAAKMTGKRVKLEFVGQDRPGIVFAISDLLHDLAVNVESMDTAVQSAPMSGEQLFSARFEVQLPAELDYDSLERRLAAIGEELMLDFHYGD